MKDPYFFIHTYLLPKSQLVLPLAILYQFRQLEQAAPELETASAKLSLGKKQVPLQLLVPKQ
jgi:hypothetical protein